VGSLILAALLCLSGIAHATEGVRAWLVAVDGGALPGSDVTVELSLADADGTPYTGRAPRLDAVDGALLEPPLPLAPGRWLARWRLPEQVVAGDVARMRALVGRQRIDLRLPVVAPPTSGLIVPDVIEGIAGQSAPIAIEVGGSDLPPPDALQVIAPVGLVQQVRATDAGLEVLWEPPSEPLPRAVPIALRDGRQPHRPPAWVSVRLVGHPRVPIHTDPGTAVHAEVGDRSYGPFVADADGLALVEARLYPGEHALTVVATDALGNERRDKLELGGHQDPSLVLLTDGQVVPGTPMPDLYVGAFEANGRPWTGPAPGCRTGVQDALGLASLGPGSWVASLPPSASRMFDLKLECSLGDAVVGDLRVPVDATVPAVVRLRVWPPELRSDQAVAQVQAWLEGPTGDRLEVDGVQLQATLGSLTAEEGPPGMTVSTYDGRAAVDAGSDEITASWRPPAGKGQPWQLDLALADVSADGVLGLVLAARDRQGRPVSDSEVAVELGTIAETATTDGAGQAVVALRSGDGSGPWVVRARSGSIERGAVLFATDAAADALPVSGLHSSVEVSIRSGVVQRVIVEARPDEVHAGGDDLARVVVDLRDRSGHPVSGALLQVDASEGRVLEITEVADGTYEAIYLPPPRLRYGQVDLRVTGQGDFAAATRLRVLPRPLRLSVGASAGWMYGARSINSPWAEAELVTRLPRVPVPLFGRVAVGGFLGQATVADDGTGSAVDLRLGVLPVGTSLLVRAERQRLAGWAGGGLVLAPYQVLAVYGDDVGIRGVGFAPPGGELLAGGGWRLGTGELQLQVSWLSLSLPEADVGWAGPIGGARASLGWKFVY